MEFDIKAAFDQIDHGLLMKAVRSHIGEGWMLLYIERWLTAPFETMDGQRLPRERGTPQGGVVSPLLANLFLHYALDRWMSVNYPRVPFERYADDVIVHCRTEREAEEVRRAIAERLRGCGLELHPEKTKIVYCKDELRKGRYTNEKFDFLGYEFRTRTSKSRTGKIFPNFSPAISSKAAKVIRDTIRSWKLPKCSDKAIEDLSRLYNPIIRGWFQYYGRFYRTALYSIIRQLDRELVLWAKRKFKKLRQHVRRARHWIARISRSCPELFAHWQLARSTAP